MALPVLGAQIDFTDGAIFISSALTLDSATLGKLDTGQLAVASDVADISALITAASIRRGRNRILDSFEAGSATVTLVDTNGDFNPSNVSGKYYGKLLPNRKIKIFADYNGTRYTLFVGFITAFQTAFALGVADRSQVVLQCTDAFRLLNNAGTGTSVIAGTTAGDLSGTRINAILNAASFPTALKAIDAGISTMQVDPGTQRTALAAIQMVADKSENGAFFVSRNGIATFLSRNSLASKLAAAPTYYDDSNTNIQFQGIEIAHDDQFLVNDVIVTRLGGVAQEVSDSTSINTYFKHTGSRDSILVQSDAEALNQAQMILALRKDAIVRIDSLTLNLFDNTANTRILAGLQTDLLDVVNVTKVMPGSSSINKELFVQGVQHDITKKSFVTKILTAEPIFKSLILNDSILGVLDSADAILSY